MSIDTKLIKIYLYDLNQCSYIRKCYSLGKLWTLLLSTIPYSFHAEYQLYSLCIHCIHFSHLVIKMCIHIAIHINETVAYLWHGCHWVSADRDMGDHFCQTSIVQYSWFYQDCGYNDILDAGLVVWYFFPEVMCT